MSHNILILAGDGIGPEIMAQAEKVLAALARDYGLDIAIERYEEGVGTQLEIISAQEAMQQAMANYAMSYYNYLMNLAQYNYLTNNAHSY